MPADPGPYSPQQVAELAEVAAKAYCNRVRGRFEYRDILGEAYIGAAKANRTFDPAKAKSMSRRQYVTLRATQQILDWQRLKANNWRRAGRARIAESLDPGVVEHLRNKAARVTAIEIEPGDESVLLKRLEAVVGGRNARIYRKVAAGMSYRQVAEDEPRRLYKGRMVVISASAVCKVNLQCREIMRAIVADYLSDE